jgi:hypothetical protein
MRSQNLTFSPRYGPEAGHQLADFIDSAPVLVAYHQRSIDFFNLARVHSAGSTKT